MTRAVLAEFRTLRLRHLKYGIGKIGDIERYRNLQRDVQEFILSLPSESQRLVMEAMYIHGRSASSAALMLYYSESQVRRIRRMVLDGLE